MSREECPDCGGGGKCPTCHGTGESVGKYVADIIREAEQDWKDKKSMRFYPKDSK